MRLLSAAIIGVEPAQLPFGLDEEHPRCLMVKERMYDAITELLDNGVRHFYTDMSLGAGLWGAELLIERCRALYSLHGILPSEEQASKWPVEYRERYFNSLAHFADVRYISLHPTANCREEARRKVVAHARSVIVLCGEDGEENARLLSYVHGQEKAVRVIDANE